MIRTILTKILPALIILVLGASIARALVKSRPMPKQESKLSQGTLVEVMAARPEPQMVSVEAMGTVIPARELDLAPEVSGRIVDINPNLVPGGFLKAGEIIAQIDPRDYEAAVKQAEARVEDARLALELEQGRQVVAKHEWSVIRPTTQSSDASSRLALREPHLDSAKANVESAQSALAQAQLNLERTVITAPFNATVKRESVEIGELVTQRMPLATLVGTDSYWIQVSVPVNQLHWISTPDARGDGGSRAAIAHRTGSDATIEREGRVVRLLSDLEPDGRMARLLVEVNDPLGLNSENNKQALPFLIGAYVNVEIEGREIANAYVIPRTAIREGDRVWIMNDDDSLSVQEVEIIWRRKDDVLIANDISPGERIITSRIPTPIPGMQLRKDNGDGGIAQGE
jgi:RND family efflux transporter MFP subunit